MTAHAKADTALSFAGFDFGRLSRGVAFRILRRTSAADARAHGPDD
jgi:hypothetical protein